MPWKTEVREARYPKIRISLDARDVLVARAKALGISLVELVDRLVLGKESRRARDRER